MHSFTGCLGNQIYSNVFYNAVGIPAIYYSNHRVVRKDYFDVHDNFMVSVWFVKWFEWIICFILLGHDFTIHCVNGALPLFFVHDTVHYSNHKVIRKDYSDVHDNISPFIACTSFLCSWRYLVNFSFPCLLLNVCLKMRYGLFLSL